MNEMLANQLFMARRYKDALPLLEKTLENNPNNKPAKRKLIISYAQTGSVRKSAILFDKLIQEDILFVIDADPIHDDCPCPEIISEVDRNNLLDNNDCDSVLKNAILMLYCNIEKSLALFERAAELSPSDLLIQNILNTIRTHHLTALN